MSPHTPRINMPVDGAEVELPAKPGVYMFKQIDGTVMYVGKATVLKERIRSYFSKNPDRQMIPDLVQNSDEIDYIITRNPSEALMLERQLIRKHKPRYNSLLKDDKSYPFIAITSEDVPRIMYSRHPPTDASRWGPFPDAKAAKRVIQLPEDILELEMKKIIFLLDMKRLMIVGVTNSDQCSKSVLDGNATILIQSLNLKWMNIAEIYDMKPQE